MATKKIPHAQALKLLIWREKFTFAKQLLDTAERAIEKLRTGIVDAHEFTDIPVDAAKGVNIKLEDGPDENGLVEVEWEAPDATS